MIKKFACILSILLVIPAIGLAQGGKMRGKVTDKATKEPLVGATIAVVGTTLGAATDVNGEYIILNIPVGSYSIKASFIGYSPVTISNIRFSTNTTTNQDFQLSTEAVQVNPVEIVAERPLIQRNTTGTVRQTTQEDIEGLAIRDVQNIVALQPGVVQQNGNLFVRGGRSGEVSYFVDNANTTNPITSTNTVTVIQEAIEELQLQAGGYTAEFGGSNAGIIRTTLRSGSSDYHGSLDYRTDDFAKPGGKFFGTSAFGYRNAVLTLSGPLAEDKLRFFVAGEHNFIRDRDQRWMTPFRFENLRIDENDARWRRDSVTRISLPIDSQAFLPGPIAFGENYVPANYQERNTLQGTLSFDIGANKLRFSGSYTGLRSPNATT